MKKKYKKPITEKIIFDYSLIVANSEEKPLPEVPLEEEEDDEW